MNSWWDKPARLAVVRAGADHHLQRAALLHLLFPVRVGGADVDRFQPGRSRGTDGRQPLAHPAQDHLPAGPAGDAFGFHHDLFQGDGTFGGPNILGSPVKYYVVATMIRGSLAVGDKADAFVLAIVLILFAMITISLNQRLVGTRRSYETIGGRGFVAKLSKLRK